MFDWVLNTHLVKTLQKQRDNKVKRVFSVWSVFSRIGTEHGDILCISPLSVRMEENTD